MGDAAALSHQCGFGTWLVACYRRGNVLYLAERLGRYGEPFSHVTWPEYDAELNL